VAGSIDPAIGGALDTPEGRLHFGMPPNATTDVVLVTIQPGEIPPSDSSLEPASAVPPPGLFRLGTTLFNISALDPAAYPVVNLYQHVTVTIDPNVGDVAAARGDRSRLTFAYFDDVARRWVALATRVTPSGSLVADSDYLGQFGILIQTPRLSVCLPPDTTLWSDSTAAASSFGPAAQSGPFQVLDQVGPRYLIQDAAGNVAWADVAAATACTASGDPPADAGAPPAQPDLDAPAAATQPQPDLDATAAVSPPQPDLQADATADVSADEGGGDL
jgi:hypothetical protein